MSHLQRITKEQELQAKRSEAYRQELIDFDGPPKVMISGRAKGYFFTKLVDRPKPHLKGGGPAK